MFNPKHKIHLKKQFSPPKLSILKRQPSLLHFTNQTQNQNQVSSKVYFNKSNQKVQQFIEKVQKLNTNQHYKVLYMDLKHQIFPHVEINQDQNFRLIPKDKIGKNVLLNGRFLKKCCQCIIPAAYQKNMNKQFIAMIQKQLEPDIIINRQQYDRYKKRVGKYQQRNSRPNSICCICSRKYSQKQMRNQSVHQSVNSNLIYYQNDKQNSNTRDQPISKSYLQMQRFIQIFIGILQIYQLDEIGYMIPMSFIYQKERYIMVWMSPKTDAQQFEYGLLPLCLGIDQNALETLRRRFNCIRVLIRNQEMRSAKDIFKQFGVQFQ